MLELPRLESSLCGCTVDRGAKIIAWLSLAFNPIKVLALICIFQLFYTAYEEEVRKGGYPERYQHNMALLQGIIVVGVVYICFSSVFSVLLLVGLTRRKACLMRPWLFLTFFGFIGSVIYSLTTFHLVNILIAILSQSVVFYCFLIVYSFYRTVKEENQLTDGMKLNNEQ